MRIMTTRRGNTHRLELHGTIGGEWIGVLEQHWRVDLWPIVGMVTGALSGWLLPRGTVLEVNEDAYIQPEPLVRAQTYQILNAILDSNGNPVLSGEQIRTIERLDNATPVEGAIR